MVEALLSVLLSIVVLFLHDRLMRCLTAMQRKLPMFAVVLILAASHSLHIWLYAGAVYVGERWLKIGHIENLPQPSDFTDYVYFSATNYTSLGYGDYIAHDGLRLIVTFECLIGLMAIGWSTAFAFWWMQRHWLRECQENGSFLAPKKKN